VFIADTIRQSDEDEAAAVAVADADDPTLDRAGGVKHAGVLSGSSGTT
jgi:hypothetical protein